MRCTGESRHEVEAYRDRQCVLIPAKRLNARLGVDIQHIRLQAPAPDEAPLAAMGMHRDVARQRARLASVFCNPKGRSAAATRQTSPLSVGNAFFGKNTGHVAANTSGSDSPSIKADMSRMRHCHATRPARRQAAYRSPSGPGALSLARLAARWMSCQSGPIPAIAGHRRPWSTNHLETAAPPTGARSKTGAQCWHSRASSFAEACAASACACSPSDGRPTPTRRSQRARDAHRAANRAIACLRPRPRRPQRSAAMRSA